MSEWKPIETAPKDGTQILLYHPHFTNNKVAAYEWVEDDLGERGDGYWIGVDGWCPVDVDDKEEATHWMPLPPPPKD